MRVHSGTVPNLRFSFADAHPRLEEGGWAREVTERELPVATALAGVNMRLEPGAVRELHWHKQAEWAYMLAGTARITALDTRGRAFLDDVGEGDLWYFPAGVPHSIQGLADGCEFLLVFDDGGFSENATFLLTDWLAHTPPEVIAANLGLDAGELPSEERYIFEAPVPGPPERSGDDGPAFSHRLSRQPPLRTGGGTVRIADSANFPAATTVAAALVEVEPGGLRELHWHPHADEWLYFIAGAGRMTVFAAAGAARTFDYRAGDAGYVPQAMGHYVENTGDRPLRFLELFRSDRFADVSLQQWLALTPAALVAAHLNLDERALRGLATEKRPVLG
ncbi:MAG TPA: cupin domain-containing protein [Solirubrobacteraceae bacterium]